jgi:hypothetical protein
MDTAYFRRSQIVERAGVAVLATLTTLTWLLSGERLTYSYFAFSEPWDHHKYLAMASGGIGDFHIAPFCWRIGKPLLAKALPFEYQTAFIVISVASVALIAILVYELARAYGHSASLAVAGMLLFMSLEWGPKFFLFDFWLPDSLAALLMTAAILAAARRSQFMFAALLVAGVMVKESMLFVAPLYYTLNARRVIDSRLGLRAAALALPAVATLIAIRLLIPAWNDDPDYIATLDIQLWNVQDGSPIYHYVDEFRAEGLPRFQRFDRRTVASYTFYSFGPALVLLPLLAVRKNLPLIVRFSPFLLLVATPMLFAQDTERFLVLAFPAVILMALNGMAAAAERLHVPEAWMLPIPIGLLGLQLSYDTRFFVPPLLQFVTMLLASLLVVFSAVLARALGWTELTDHDRRHRRQADAG